MFDFNALSFAYGKPQASGLLKMLPEDFQVDEVLDFELTGEGEHLFLRVEKKGLNTEELVKFLARALARPEKTISYAGLKDRQALTTQWLSVHCPGEDIADANLLQGPGWRVVEAKRHFRKLKTGALAANDFTLALRNLTEKQEIEERLARIQSGGVPNYFGPQRFGFQGQNLVKAQSVLLEGTKVKNRFLRGIYYSAARAFLFNLLLSQRVKDNSWQSALTGDVMQLAGSHSIFAIETPDELIHARIANFDISPAAPLWGRGSERASIAALQLQEDVLALYKPWCDALESHGLERAYRSLRLKAGNLHWCWKRDDLILKFRLEPGSYATSLVRELIVQPNGL